MEINNAPINEAFLKQNKYRIDKGDLFGGRVIQPLNMTAPESLNENIEDVKYDYNEALYLELNHENMKLIKIMIENGFNPTMIFRKSWSHLYYALQHSKNSILDILLASPNNDVNVKNEHNDKEPAFFGLVYGYNKTTDEKVTLFRKLIDKHGAKIDITNYKGNTFLMKLLATDCGWTSSFTDVPVMVEELITHKPNLNTKNNKGEGVFHILAKRALTRQINGEVGAIDFIKKIKKIASLLLESGAKLDTPDNNLDTPLDVAIKTDFAICPYYNHVYVTPFPPCKPVAYLSAFIPPKQQIKEFEETFDKIINYYKRTLSKRLIQYELEISHYQVMKKYSKTEKLTTYLQKIAQENEKLTQILKVCEEDLVEYLNKKCEELEKTGETNKVTYLNEKLTKIRNFIKSVRNKQKTLMI